MDDNRRYEAFVRNRITELREQKRRFLSIG